MNDQPTQHYLRIYRLKLAMAEEGTTGPSPAAMASFRRFMAVLEALDVNAPIRLETTLGVARFTDARSRMLLAEAPMRQVS
jgi:hypothetical protein